MNQIVHIENYCFYFEKDIMDFVSGLHNSAQYNLYAIIHIYYTEYEENKEGNLIIFL